jgi:hypothetical protein
MSPSSCALEAAGLEDADLGVALRQTLGEQRLFGRPRRDVEGEPCDQRGDEPCEHEQRPQQPHGPDAAGADRGHLAVAIQAAERQHHAEEEPEGRQDQEVVHGCQAEQSQHSVARQLTRRRFAEHAREAVAHEDEHEHQRDRERRGEHFAQQIAVEDPRHRALKPGIPVHLAPAGQPGSSSPSRGRGPQPDGGSRGRLIEVGREYQRKQLRPAVRRFAWSISSAASRPHARARAAPSSACTKAAGSATWRAA